MKKARCFSNVSPKAQQGFTLVELITVVILLGILAIAVAPRFSDRSGYSEFTLQQRLLSALRNTQLKALYDTRTDFCYRMILSVVVNGNHRFGPSTASYLPGQQANSCDLSIDEASEEYLRSEDQEMISAGIRMTAVDGSTPINFVQFDNLGKPLSSAGACSSTCSVTFSGQNASENVRICIEPEGYIHAC